MRGRSVELIDRTVYMLRATYLACVHETTPKSTSAKVTPRIVSNRVKSPIDGKKQGELGEVVAACSLRLGASDPNPNQTTRHAIEALFPVAR